METNREGEEIVDVHIRYIFIELLSVFKLEKHTGIIVTQ